MAAEFSKILCQSLPCLAETGTKTLLGKIVGVYKVGYKSEATRTGLKMDLLIMENLFYKKEVDKSYDLKVRIGKFLQVTLNKASVTDKRAIVHRRDLGKSIFFLCILEDTHLTIR